MEIRWSKFALQDLEQIEDYIGTLFTYKEYQNFMNILNHKIILILDRKVVFQKLEKFPDYNKILITEQTTLIYRLETKYLKILRLYNNFQDEDKKFIIDDLFINELYSRGYRKNYQCTSYWRQKFNDQKHCF